MTVVASVRTWRNRLSARHRDWALNVFWGLLIEAIVLITHAGGYSWVEAVKNAPLDRMMRSSAALATQDGLVPPLVFIDIDDATWRSASWGGGEPYRAPRDRLFLLVDHAFANGARQVVLDVLVEGRGSIGDSIGDSSIGDSSGSDEAFAAQLRALKQRPYFGAGKRLVLVRSIRRGIEPGAPDELRASALDALIAESGDRIAIAAPYFRYSPDRILRDWQLLEIACVMRDGAPAQWAVIPAVQLVVAAHHAGVLLPEAVVPLSAGPSTLSTTAATTTATSPAATGCASDATKAVSASTLAPPDRPDPKSRMLADGWERTRQAFLTAGIDLGAKMPPIDSLGNRIVFRLADPPRLELAQVVSAADVLDGRAARHDIEDAIVVIGQSYPEAGDRHATPLGEMAGALVLLNGIDSMIRHHVIRPPSPWLTVPLVVLLIVFVGYVFARWDSTLGPLIATTAATVVLFLGSYQLFKHGLWMDFGLPLLGIQIRKSITTFIEAIPKRKRRGPPGPTAGT